MSGSTSYTWTLQAASLHRYILDIFAVASVGYKKLFAHRYKRKIAVNFFVYVFTANLDVHV